MDRIERIKRLEKIHREELRRKEKRIEQEKKKIRNIKAYLDERIERCEDLLEESTEECHQGLNSRILELKKIKYWIDHPFIYMAPPKVKIPSLEEED